MNILQILPELNVGGVETGTLDLAKYLVRLNHKAVVVSAGGTLVKELESIGARHYQLNVHKKSFFSMLKMIPLLAEIIKKEEIDIVHARSRVPAWIAFFACRRTGCVFITTCHGYYSTHLFSRIMGWAKRVIVLSNVIGRHMIEDLGLPHERVRLIPRSVDLERFAYMDPEKKRKEVFNVGIIGRITPIKGHAHFIKAMAKVARVVPQLKIWIIGDAPGSKQLYKEEIQLLVRRLGLWHCTEFLGNQRDIPEILSHLDLLVLATVTHEAFGRVIVEAQACGVPVVATRVGGVVDIITHEKNGLLVPPADPASMADAVVRVFKEVKFAKQLAEHAYKKVKEKYNVELMVKSTLEVYKEALNSFTILIIKLSSLGDIILSSAALRALREKFKVNYKISFLVGEESKEVLLRCPYIDELLVADRTHKDRGIKGLVSLGSALRNKRFDIVIDLQNNRYSHLLSWLTFSPKRYGYDNKKLGFLLNFRLKDEKPPLDPVTHQFRVLKLLGVELQEPRLELWPSEQDMSYVNDLLASHWLSVNQKLIGLNLHASPRWRTKVWPLEYAAKLCEDFLKHDVRVVITGTKEDVPYAESLIHMVKTNKPIIMCGKTSINQLACLIKRCAVFISSDSAPLHIAAAMQTPFVALFGPTDSRRHMPAAEKFVVLKKDLACAPCYKAKCKTNACMVLIKPEEVLKETLSLLARP